MTDLTQPIESALRDAVVSLFGDAFADLDPLVQPANNPKFGDYQANVAMPLAKRLGKDAGSPRDVAQQLIDALKLDDRFDTPTIAGPGFINLTIKPEALGTIADALLADGRLGVAIADDPQTVVIDYSSPNVAKEMHVGHLRSTVIGDALARVLSFQGHSVVAQNHVGDWGTQFGMLIAYLRLKMHSDIVTSRTGAASGDNFEIGDFNRFYKESKVWFDESEEHKEIARDQVVKLQAGDEAAIALWRFLREISQDYFDGIYHRLGIRLTTDDICGESFYNPKLPGVIDRLQADGAAVESEGALVVFVDGYTDRDDKPLPMIVRKSDGGYLYATTDFAAAQHRIETLKGDRLIYVVGSPQRQHFEMLFATLRKYGWADESVRLDYVPFGSVLGEDGKMFKTRSGETVRLVDLIDEAEQRAAAAVKAKNPDLADDAEAIGKVVGIGALKYADLSSDRVKDYKFSWDRMLALEGNTAPYLINAYVRVCSIFRKAELDMADYSASIEVGHDNEKALVLKLMQFGPTVGAVAESLEPHRLCNYLYDLASAFHKFYEHCPVLRSDVAPDVRGSRLALCKLVAGTLEQGLDLLGIGVVERM
ncbi:arginine--tRNA ligase [Phycisphaeraceae bacterium D3-23]